MGVLSGWRVRRAHRMVDRAVSLALHDRYDAAFALNRKIADTYGGSSEPGLQVAAARALVNSGIDLHNLGRYAEVASVADEVIDRYGNTTDPQLRQRAANALWQKGHSKFADDLLIEALAAFEEVDERFGGPAESAGARRFAYEAMLGHAAVRCATGDLEEGLAEFDRIVDRLGDDAAPEFVASAAKALAGKAAILVKNDRLDESVDIAYECVKRFGHVDHPLVQIEVAAASAFSLDGLRALGRYDDVVATAEDVVARVGDQLVPYYRELRVELVVAGALMNKADALKELGYRDAALAALDEIMFRFGSDREPALLRMVAGARAYAQQLQRE